MAYSILNEMHILNKTHFNLIRTFFHPFDHIFVLVKLKISTSVALFFTLNWIFSLWSGFFLPLFHFWVDFSTKFSTLKLAYLYGKQWRFPPQLKCISRVFHHSTFKAQGFEFSMALCGVFHPKSDAFPLI